MSYEYSYYKIFYTAVKKKNIWNYFTVVLNLAVHALYQNVWGKSPRIGIT